MVTFGLGIKFGITAFLAHLPLYNISYLWAVCLYMVYPKIAFYFLCRHNTKCIVVQNKHSEELKRLFYLCTNVTNSTLRTNPTHRQDYKNGLCPTA